LVTRDSVASLYDHVSTLREIEVLGAQVQIVEVDRPFAHMEAQRGGPSLRGSGSAGAWVTLCLFVNAREILARATARESAAGIRKRRNRFGVRRAPRTLEEDFTVPLEAKGFEGAQHGVGATRNHAWRIQILDAYQPACAIRACV